MIRESDDILECLSRVISLNDGWESEIERYYDLVGSINPSVYSACEPLHLSDVARALRRFLSAQMTAAQLSQWAGLLEGNDFVEYAPGEERDIADALFRLAAPEINGALSHVLCTEMLSGVEEAIRSRTGDYKP